MHALLGIDAAWTATAASGVALIVGDVGAWRCVRAAPSRRAFVAGDGTAPIDFTASYADDDVPLGRVIEVACTRAGVRRPSVIAVDMPLARGEITGRRIADASVSRAYGAKGCAVHSPSAARPGVLAARMRDEAAACGVPLVTRGAVGVPALIEVYPHVALLRLMGVGYRVPYKVARMQRYWPGESSGARISALIRTWRAIEAALEREVGELPDRVEVSEASPRRALKAYEDAIDGIVCAWVGALYVEGRAEALGDGDAAIWVPGDGGMKP